MRLRDFGLILIFCAGCNQISGADDFTFDEETSDDDAGVTADSGAENDRIADSTQTKN